MTRSGGAAIALLMTLLLSPAAMADSKDPTAAEALFLAGRDAMQRGDIATACAKFGESDRLDPAAGTAANLADCEEKLGKIGAAWAHWKEAVELLPTDDSRLGPMRDRATALEKRVPRLTVRAAPTLPADATLVRDGVAMTRASFDTAIPDDPGDHEIVVTAPEHASRSYKINLKEGEAKEIVVDAGEALPDAPPPIPIAASAASPLPPPLWDDPNAGRTQRLIGFSLLGVGVIGAGVGTVTGIVAIGKKSDLSSNCFPANVCNAQGASDASTGHTMATISTVSFIVAGATLAGGALLILTAPHSRLSEKPRGSMPRVAPLIGPGIAGIFAEKSF